MCNLSAVFIFTAGVKGGGSSRATVITLFISLYCLAALRIVLNLIVPPVLWSWRPKGGKTEGGVGKTEICIRKAGCKSPWG